MKTKDKLLVEESNKSSKGKKGYPDGKRSRKGKSHKTDPSLLDRNNSIRNSNTGNDPAWWLPNGIEAQGVASYPWNTMAGFDIRDAIKGAAGDFTPNEAPNIAGICKLTMQSTLPLSNSDNSALNRASLGLFADILTKNSSNVPFEHTDLMMSLIALSEIDSWIVAGMRAYGLIHNYPVKNRYVAKALVRACGFDYDSLISDPYAFIAKLNVMISRRNRFYIPKSFNWRSREVWLTSNVYKDSDDPKSQFYVFTKDSYGIWSPRSSTQGSEILQHSVSADYSNQLTQSDYFSLLEDMLNPLEIDQDIYIMQGYLLKRYDISEFAVIPMISPDIVTEPVIDYSVLTMIQNAKIYTDTANLEDPAVYTNFSQRNGQFDYSPTFKTNAFNTGNILLTSPFNEPKAEDTIEATRLIISITNVEDVSDEDGGLVATCNPASLNADVVTSITFISLTSDGREVTFGYDATTWGINIDNITPSARYLLTQISYFDFHPILPVCRIPETGSTEFIGFIGDFDNTMILSQENLAKLGYVTSFGIVNIVNVMKQ